MREGIEATSARLANTRFGNKAAPLSLPKTTGVTLELEELLQGIVDQYCALAWFSAIEECYTNPDCPTLSRNGESPLKAVRVGLQEHVEDGNDATYRFVGYATDRTLDGRMAQMIGVNAADMMAAGDSYNDLPLLRLCGFGIAMGEAPDELKAVADFVTAPVEEDDR